MAEEDKRRAPRAAGRAAPAKDTKDAKGKGAKAAEEETTFVTGTGVVENEDGEDVLTDQVPVDSEAAEETVGAAEAAEEGSETVDGQPNTASPTSSTGGADVSR